MAATNFESQLIFEIVVFTHRNLGLRISRAEAQAILTVHNFKCALSASKKGRDVSFVISNILLKAITGPESGFSAR